MITIKKLEDSYLLHSKILFGNNEEDSKYIDLRPHGNLDAIHSQMDKKVIDFPGEYDIEGIFIKAILGKGNLMNYFIKTKTKSFAIIQNAKALEDDDLVKVENWVFLDEAIEKKLDQLELEWDRINLSTTEINTLGQEEEIENTEKEEKEEKIK